MKSVFIAAVLVALPMQLYAQHRHDTHDMEELVVSGEREKVRADTAMPVNVLTGEALKEDVAGTLGETLKQQIGVTSASFGPGVGQPVIRGQSGNRVRVLQNGLGTLDASLASQDHANAVEPMLAERIEVIRGPATLLYGNGAIGGVVNVIDNRIPDAMPEAFTGAAELRYGTVDHERAGVFKLDGGGGAFAWHLDGVFRETDNVEIPGLAVDVEAVESLHEHEDDEAAEEHGEAIENTDGFIANSDTETTSANGGLSWIGVRGFLGVSVGRLENDYGLPPGGHAHRDEDEQEGEDHDEEHGDVRIDMGQTRTELKGGRDFDGFFSALRGRLAVNDYEHRELEGVETGTVFTNKGWEGRLSLNHEGDRLAGTWGLQRGEREFAAVGGEAFIPASDIQNSGLFVVETFDTPDWVYEFGARVESRSVDPKVGGCNNSQTTWSTSASAIRRLNNESNVLLSLSRSERAPVVEELLSNIDLSTCTEPADPEQLVVHAPTARFEIGNPDLNTETSQNVELAFRKHAGGVRAEVNLFHNRVDDYIYLADTGEFEGTVVSRYLQDEVTFSGVETELIVPVPLGVDRHMDLVLFGDAVRAEFDDGGNVPRIPPRRIGIELGFPMAAWVFKLRATSADDQDEVALNETPTDGYTRVDLYADYHLDTVSAEWLFFLKGNNLTDETIRNHVSFLKHYAPEAGRGIEMGLRYRF